ncbi:3-ketoacyl-ACP synthase [Streptomyces kaniharaensis]|uniref:3-ketoacyl-ACP synthase n=2 Tax=Streptomyces kaniharaensis TaxID=212423 RepID=A0A6N7KYW2_9ACTN|nr:3-ketoacyl-ACP synthase [Streptomyces kaniharaensis]
MPGDRAPGVAIVATGAITSQGAGTAALWGGARSGRVAIRPVQGLPMDGLGTKLGGEVTAPLRPRGAYRRPDDFRERAVDLALVAAEEAMAGLPAGLVDPDRFGVVLGTCNAGLLSARAWLAAGASGAVPDHRLPALVTPQALAEAVAAALRLRGPVLAVNTACASGANAIGWAADLLRQDRVDAVLAGGSDALSDVVLAGFNSLESLSPEPAAPYSADRQGLSLGEGSGMVVLVRSDLAERHGLTVLAEVAGYGLSADGYHVTAPHPEGLGAAGAIRAALAHAGLCPADIGYINGHGTGTPKNDPAESSAIRLALGKETAAGIPVSSTKSVIGHLLGAAGAAEAIVTAHALAEQIAPPTAGFSAQDPACPLDYVPGTARPIAAGAALSNNFAFGGANAALVLTRPALGHRPPAAGREEVVVTGISVLSPAGDGVSGAWRDVMGRREPGGELAGVRVGRVELDPEPYLNRRARRRMDRLGVLSVVATAKALEAAGIEPGGEPARTVGVIFGTGTGPMEAMERFTLPVLGEGPAAADPAVFPNTVYNQAAGQVALNLGLRGPTSTVSVGHATGAAAIGYAADLLAAGRADTLVATATDTLTAQVARAYTALGAASTRGPSGAPDGRFLLAEGSVALVLERRSVAEARGARILGTVLGYGMASDASRARLWDPRGRGLERAMRAALHDAGLGAEEVAEIWLSAAGLDPADRAEAAAVARLAVDPALRLHAPKTVLGEPMGVGGALCAALALHTGDGTPALVNSSSLGGTHITLAVRAAAAGTTRTEGEGR